jgi:hypothetical protein
VFSDTSDSEFEKNDVLYPKEKQDDSSKSEEKVKYNKVPARSKVVSFSSYSVSNKGPLIFAVYNGNFPNVVRSALALRKDKNGISIWKEMPADTDQIMDMDLVWKPFNFYSRGVSYFLKSSRHLIVYKNGVLKNQRGN